MESIDVLPNIDLDPEKGKVNRILHERGQKTFKEAAYYIKSMSYGYNSPHTDPLILFEENMGTCYTKHSVAVICAKELEIPLEMHLCFYGITEEIVTGIQSILDEHKLPFIPAAHCFLKYKEHCIDLTEGNCNGKNVPINKYFHSLKVDPYVTAENKSIMLNSFIENTLVHNELKGCSIENIKSAQQKTKKWFNSILSCLL